MEPILIQGVLLNQEVTDILIDHQRIAGIGNNLPVPANAIRIDGARLAAFPSLPTCTPTPP